MDWETAEAVLEESVASTFDTKVFRAVPRKAGASVNHGKVADPDRTAFTFAGSLDFSPPGRPSEQRQAGDPVARQQAIFFEAVLTAHVAGWPWMPRRDDLVEAVPDGEQYEIKGVDGDGTARRAFLLNRAR